MLFTACLLDQARQHPAMQPQDALKMCYQAAFGAEHLLSDPSAARRYLLAELSACGENAAEPLSEPLSEDTVRVNLRAWNALHLPQEWLFSLFSRSCRPRAQGDTRFSQYLSIVDTLCAAEKLPFSAAQWQAEKNACLSDGIHAVHHSARYRAAEQPAYRIISARLARMLPLLTAAASRTGICIIALDGRAASGKTTLSADFSSITGAGVIHMDDFFLPAALRTPTRLSQPGGNVHYERFRDDVLPHLVHPDAFAYPRFDCASMTFSESQQVAESRIRLVEGAYSCHPQLGEYMHVRAFSDVEKTEQLLRIRTRDGDEQLQRYQERWIPMEEAYIRTYGIRENAAIIL